jgi:hypothetical protein
MLGTPTLARVPTVEYSMSLIRTMNLLMQHGHFLDTCFVGGDAFVSKARNGIVQSFIETWSTPYPADILLFIDDDQAWDENSVLRIIQDPHEVIGVAVPKKMDMENGIQTFNNVLLDTDPDGRCFVENGLLRISQIGSGFLAIKRSAIEKMMKAYPRRYSPGDGGNHKLHYAFFDAKIIWDADPAVIGQFWGEDLIFCKQWCALGKKLWLDPNVTMSHIGRKTWTGNFCEFLQKHAAVELKPMPVMQPIPSTLEAIEKLAA